TTDISLLKDAEEAQRIARESAEKNAVMKSRFLTNVSHELRTPLNAIIGIAEVLYEKSGRLDGEQTTEGLGRVLNAGRHLLQLINDILDLSKIEAGKVTPVLEEFKVSSLVDEVVSTIAILAARNGNHLLVRQGAGGGAILADRMRLRQSLINLLRKAAKFTFQGEIVLSVGREIAGTEDWIVLSVTDTGVGIANEHIERLFEEFGQAEATTSRRFGGTGLGLIISDRLCRLMGGRITV